MRFRSREAKRGKKNMYEGVRERKRDTALYYVCILLCVNVRERCVCVCELASSKKEEVRRTTDRQLRMGV